MLTISFKNKETHENLKQLGIRSKRINERNSRSTQKFLRTHNETIDQLNYKNSSEKNGDLNKDGRTLGTSIERRSSVPEQYRLTHELAIKKQNVIHMFPTRTRKNRKHLNLVESERQVKIPIMSYIKRKDSDIRPWQN